MFKGVCTALITPFNKNGVDYDAFAKLIEYQISNGVSALLICGTTGEPSTMSSAEKESLIKFAIKTINKRVIVMVGTGANNTSTAIENSILAEKLGADCLLVVTPYYNKCTQNGLVAHYQAICESVNIPVFCYNVPGRTGVNIMPQTALKLSKIKNMVAIKEASGNVAQIAETARLLQNEMDVYSGDDGLCLPIMALGAKGLISVSSNIAPKQVCELVDYLLKNDYENARAMQFKLAPLFDALFCEVNPIPSKYACSLLGICENNVRLPLTPLQVENEAKVKNAMAELGLI